MNLAVLGAIAASNRDHGYSLWNNGNPHSNTFKALRSDQTSEGPSATTTSTAIKIEDTLNSTRVVTAIGCEHQFSKADMDQYSKMSVRLKKNATFSGTVRLIMYAPDRNGALTGSSMVTPLSPKVSGITNSSFNSDGVYEAVFDLTGVTWRAPTYGYKIIFGIEHGTGTQTINWDIQKWQLLK